MNNKFIILATDGDGTRDDEILRGGFAATQKPTKPQGPILSSDYEYKGTENRFEQPKPNIVSAQVIADYAEDPTVLKATKARTRKESKTAFGRFIMDSFFEKYPSFANKVNFEAIVEAANISAELKVWYAAKRSEWTNMVQFPDWAVNSLNNEEFEKVQSDIAKVAGFRRDRAVMEANLSKHVSELQNRIKQNSLSKLETVYKSTSDKTNWLSVIFTLTTENLPLDRVFDIVKYRVSDANKTEAEINDPEYLTPVMYESKVLDDFRKECFEEWKRNKTLTEFLKGRGVNLPTYDKNLGDGDLSDIKDIVLGSSTTVG